MFISCNQDVASVVKLSWVHLTADLNKETKVLTLSLYILSLCYEHMTVAAWGSVVTRVRGATSNDTENRGGDHGTRSRDGVHNEGVHYEEPGSNRMDSNRMDSQGTEVLYKQCDFLGR
jgi:hypothetical protein